MPDADPLTSDFATRFPDSFARILGRAEAAEISRVLDELPPKVKASIVARLPATHISRILDSGEHAPQQWLADAPFDEAVTMLSRIPRERRLAMVNSLDDRARRVRLLRHQQYPAHSVGALVNDVTLRIRSDTRAVDVIRELKEMDGEEPGTMVVVDPDGRYFGLPNVWRLLTDDAPIGQIRDYVLRVSPIFPETPVARAVQNDDWSKHNWLPVVDNRQRVLGGVSRARLLRAATVTTPLQRSAGAVLVDLITDLFRVLGALLDRAFARGGSP